MSSVVFADTFFRIALTNSEDLAHEESKSLIRGAKPGSIVTTDYVLTEYLNYFSAWGPDLRRKTAFNVEQMLANPSARVLPATRETFMNGLDLFRARPDKGYSMTDCISMQIMKRVGLTEVLTNDRHFNQEGFRALFRNPGP
jgi:uncharacterized protein